MCALVSIIIPTYNRSADLKRAIESVILQTYNNWELIVVDNNSTDNTDEVINKVDGGDCLYFGSRIPVTAFVLVIVICDKSDLAHRFNMVFINVILASQGGSSRSPIL